MQKAYVYIFTRQDISPEQQLVQSSHVALKLGFYAANDDSIMMDPDNTYFTCVGVRNERALGAVGDILDDYDFGYECFIESDMNDEITSIATYPIHEDNRGPLLAFNWLKF